MSANYSKSLSYPPMLAIRVGIVFSPKKMRLCSLFKITQSLYKVNNSMTAKRLSTYRDFHITAMAKPSCHNEA
ncbi:hypothetical protein [Desulfamplus magnetovallimortis]|uniref:hypothetical protein n=1 Tax=Desulfamplus magnetovallimortis TaxID=1246637 RepID=UPI001118FABB|nr:hypothetical protein [Desulfamplus magnetovallimortis]